MFVLGVLLIDGGIVCLFWLVGFFWVLDFILIGREIGVREVYEFGLVNWVVFDGKGKLRFKVVMMLFYWFYF